MTSQQCRLARTRLGFTIDDLASDAGVATAEIARFESGKTIGFISLQKIRLAFASHRVRFVDEGPFKGTVYMGLRVA